MRQHSAQKFDQVQLSQSCAIIYSTKITEKQMVSASQIRSARALLGWTAHELAHIADVSWATIQRFEATEGVPPSRVGTLEKVIQALEAAGVEFIGDPVASPGVRLRRR